MPSLSDRILRYVKRNPLVTNTQIAKALRASSASVSSTTNRLYDRGILDREQSSPTKMLPWLYFAIAKH